MSHKYSLTLHQKQNCRLVQIESISRQQSRCDLKTEISQWKCRKYCKEMRKCRLPVFSPFLILFAKVFLLRVIRNQDCVVKGQNK